MTISTNTDRDQPSSRGPRRRIMIIAIASGAVIGGLATAGWAADHSDNKGDSVTITEQVTTLEVDVAAGDVEVIGSARDDVALEWRGRSWMFSDSAVAHQVTNGRLTVTGECDSGFLSGCSTDVALKVPADVEVVVTGSAGNVTVAGLDSVTDLRTDAGDIRAERQSGDITAHSSAGNVVVAGLAADTATFTSDAGDVLLDVREPGADLVAQSSAGNVTVTVPDDGKPYAVDARTEAGDNTVEVPTDPAAERTVEASTQAGDVAVTTP